MKLVSYLRVIHNKGLLYSGLLLSVSGGFMSSSFFFFWGMLELNTLFFVGILWGGNPNWGSLESMKYFLVQGVSSLLILMGVFFMSDLVLMISGLIKLGFVPFHLWMLEVASGCNWINWGVLMTVQKFLPLELISKVGSVSYYVGFLASGGVLVSCLESYHKSNMKVLMFFSSLFNLSLLLTCLEDGSKMLLLLSAYSLILVSSVSVLSKMGHSHFQQSNQESGGLFLCLLALGGFPPSLGFFFKWVVLSGVMTNWGVYLSVLVVLGSLWMFYIYLSIFMESCLLSSVLFLGTSSVPSPLELFLGIQILGSILFWVFL